MLFVGGGVGALGLRVFAFRVARAGAVVAGGEGGGALGEGTERWPPGAGDGDGVGVEDGEAEVAWKGHPGLVVTSLWVENEQLILVA